jgi:hypothetical protein
MAHVILFTDRAPEQRHRYGKKLNSIRYNYAAAAYKLATVIRSAGFTVLVVPNCLSLSFAGVQKIIRQNSKNLLWVGISTTLMLSHSTDWDSYRSKWLNNDSDFVDPGLLFETIYDITSVQGEMPWGHAELGEISRWLTSINTPLILGGAVVTEFLKGGLKTLDKNTHIVRGNSEVWVVNFTVERNNDRNFEPPYVNNNSEYDNTDFKLSTIKWESEDIIHHDDWLPIEVARGCAFNCAYCTYEHKGRFDLFKDPEILRAELIRNYELYGVTKYMLVDDLYNDSKNKIRILHDKVWSKLPFKPQWTAYMRLDMFWADPESIELIEASGAVYGTLGIETLHDVAGRKVGKGLGKHRILETLENLKSKWQDRVLLNSQFIAGLPDEPIEHIRETMEWCAKTDLLHSISWNPLFIAPPTGWRHSDRNSKMGLDNSHYGITWNGRVWQNNTGVTFTMVDDLVKEYYQHMNKSYRVHFGNYSDLRSAGLSHADIITLPKTPVEQLPLEKLGEVLEHKVQDRLNNILNRTDN